MYGRKEATLFFIPSITLKTVWFKEMEDIKEIHLNHKNINYAALVRDEFSAYIWWLLAHMPGLCDLVDPECHGRDPISTSSAPSLVSDMQGTVKNVSINKHRDLKEEDHGTSG